MKGCCLYNVKQLRLRTYGGRTNGMKLLHRFFIPQTIRSLFVSVSLSGMLLFEGENLRRVRGMHYPHILERE